MDGKFTCKYILVSGGHKMAPPLPTTYSSVATRESVKPAFLITGLNNIDICAWNIGNSYLNSPCREKLWTEAGSEFGSEKGYVLLIGRDIYGMKSSWAYWRANLAYKLNPMGHRSTESESDVRINRAKIDNGNAYYKWMWYMSMLCYTLQRTHRKICWSLTRFIDWRKLWGHQIDILVPTSINFS